MGQTHFYGLDFLVDERVLIPRQETEILVDVVIDMIKGAGDRGSGIGKNECEMNILDMGTGSGNIAISLTKNIPECRIVASDVSQEALDVAKMNADRMGVSDRVDFVKSDLFCDIKGLFDMIVSNPPYISRPEIRTLAKEVLMEPKVALDGGNDGLDFYRKIISSGIKYLKPGGYFVFEIGFGQRKEICDLIEKDGILKVVKVTIDHNEIDRIVAAKWIN
jgi:release factor glutamine methyltransferase